jgi:hypothetical protein
VAVCRTGNQAYTNTLPAHSSNRRTRISSPDENDDISWSDVGAVAMKRHGLIGAAGLPWVAALEASAAHSPVSGDPGSPGAQGLLLPAGALNGGASHPPSYRYSNTLPPGVAQR